MEGDGTENQLGLFPGPPASPRWWERAVLVIPAVAAVSLAVLYAVGALVKAAEFEGAGLSVRDVLPLLPLETILGAGISVVVRSLLFLVAFAFLGVVAPPLVRRRLARADQKRAERRKREGQLVDRVNLALEKKDQEELRRLLVRLEREDGRERVGFGAFAALGILVVLAYGFLLMLIPPPLSVAFLISLVVPIIAMSSGLRLRRYVTYYILFQYTLILGGLLVSAFAYPDPLPSAQVYLHDRHVVPGELIVATNSTWYLSRHNEIVALPTRSFDRATFETRSRDRPASTGTRVLNWIDSR